MTELYEAPHFYQEFAVISDDASLAALASSMVGNEGEYVSVVKGPRMMRPDADAEVGLVCNGVGRVRPGKVLIVGMDQATESALNARLPQGFTIHVHNREQLQLLLERKKRSKLNGELRCRQYDVGYGLLRAKRDRKILVVDDTAEAIITTSDSTVRDHAVVLDDHDAMVQVIAANFAYSIDADLILIPERDDTLREQVYVELDSRAAHRGETRGQRAQQSLRDFQVALTPALQFGPRKLVTFITGGIPYGYFYRDAISTHLFSQPQLGEIINAGIYRTRSEPFISSAVLIDPGQLKHVETPVIGRVLQSEGVNVFSVMGEQANVETTGLFIQVFPYDLLFICSHCGEIPGQRLTINIPDAAGVTHAVEIEEAVAIASAAFGDKPNHVHVHAHYHPASIDGSDWFSASPELRRYIWKYILAPATRKSWNIVNRVDIPRVPHSTAIQVADGALMLNMTHAVDVRTSPIIINNGCVSFYEAARVLTIAGARSYIGTLSPVDSPAAKLLAETVFTGAERTTSLPLALDVAQKKVFSDPDERTYVHVGCHFCQLHTPKTFARFVCEHRLSEALESWQAHTPEKQFQKDRASEFVRFLSMFKQE